MDRAGSDTTELESDVIVDPVTREIIDETKLAQQCWSSRGSRVSG